MFGYIARNEARGVGLTHEGSIYGCPAWIVADESNEEVVVGTPKFIPLNYWCRFCGWVYDRVADIMPTHMVLVSPITVKGRIK